ncbi:putative DNA repair protein [Klebsormidium nitens]|uniref:Putative DNA repair protein n=1 Tax=Klebsormidium nitens TaxID=105231 RepID=A0A1Y1IHY0_KLENI|nr:putative DNA repair protein [Klebsormidium nitens]|eukprot:GAQ87748.1 putative DNA repair protein [Klebsormidium nitens]
MDAARAERVILHIDVDCFYAQVEESRRPELKGRPLGIYQKFLVVTCNYPARAAGVAKMCPKEDALRVCPDLVLVNGEDLTPYRAVSKRILEVMRRFGVVERRGMDEAYLDVTEEVRKRLSLAAGPNPLYRGFVGKVLAGPTENPVSGTGLVRLDPPTNSQATPRGEPGLRSVPAAKPEASASVTFSGRAQNIGSDLENDRTAREGGSPIGPTEGGGRGDGLTHIEARQDGEREVALEEPEKEAEVAFAENGRSSGERNDRVELTKRFVPPGWWPLMRPEARERGNADVIMGVDGLLLEGAQPMRAPSPETADPNNPESSLLPAGPPILPTSQSGAALAPSIPTSQAFNPENIESGTFNPRSSFHEASQCHSVQRPSLSPGFANDSSDPPLNRPVTPPGRSQYGSLAEAFGSVLKPQERSPGNIPTETGPPRKKARSEPEAGFGTKTPSWLDWRNEADPGLPTGTPSPGHISAGKTAGGKLPGHWSDVRQVRFQVPAPEGVLKTTEKLDFGADVAGSDWLLLVGSHVAVEVREAVWAEVGCRCSAGVAHNKMLAKLASPMNKPNGQTTMLAGAVADHIQNLAARKIPGIGWSYDAKLREMKVDTIGDLQKLALSELEDKFGARVGSMIYHCCRGNDTSPVEDKGPPKSLSVEDSFRACLNLKQAEGIVKALAPDYIERLDEERDDTGRRPKTLTVKWRQKGASYQGQSTSGPMPLDIVATSLPKARREEALIRSAMSLLSKAFAGKKFHLVKLNVGATNFVEEAAKGTPSLLSAWARKERSGTGAVRKDYLLEGGRGGGEEASRGDAATGTKVGEAVGGMRQNGSETGRNGVPLLQTKLEADGLQLGGVTNQEPEVALSSGVEINNTAGGSASMPEDEGENGSGVIPPESGGAGSFGNGLAADKNSFGTTEKLLREDLDVGATALLSSPYGVKSPRVSGAYAGSVLHANVGSKREARATREAAEGVKPVLGNGHAEAKAPWFANPGGLASPGEELDDRFVSAWDLEEGRFGDRGGRVPGRGFDLEAGEESDEREDLWEDLQSVRLEKRGLRADPRSVSGGPSVQGRNGESASHAPQLTNGFALGLVQQNEVKRSHPAGLRADGGLLGSDRNTFREANGANDEEQSEAVDYEAASIEAKGLEKGNPYPSRHGSSFATISPVPLSPDKAKSLTATSKQVDQARHPSGNTLVEASTSVNYGTSNQKSLAVKAGEKCSVCGESLPAEPSARREHVDFHVAMKLQKEEEKIGKLFKEVGSRTGVTKGVTSGQGKPSRVVSNGRAPKRTVQTLEALWKRS